MLGILANALSATLDYRPKNLLKSTRKEKMTLIFLENDFIYKKVEGISLDLFEFLTQNEGAISVSVEAK